MATLPDGVPTVAGGTRARPGRHHRARRLAARLHPRTHLRV